MSAPDGLEVFSEPGGRTWPAASVLPRGARRIKFRTEAQHSDFSAEIHRRGEALCTVVKSDRRPEVAGRVMPGIMRLCRRVRLGTESKQRRPLPAALSRGPVFITR